MKLFKTIAIIVVILLLLGFAVKQLIDYNALADERDQLQAQVDALEHENAKKQAELDMPFEERVKKKAKESGYRDPDAVYYYNDQNNPE